MKKQAKPTTVDEYIAQAPKEIQARLKQIRAAIKATAPGAEEKLSYSMPYYGYKGRLAYFAAFTRHIGLYIPTPTIEEHAKELGGWATSKATVQFPHEKKLPISLVKMLIRARVKTNEGVNKSSVNRRVAATKRVRLPRKPAAKRSVHLKKK
ncbi:MAG: DUF1801 domain-containing protein [Candidatus Zixiibacteriota bacterium]